MPGKFEATRLTAWMLVLSVLLAACQSGDEAKSSAKSAAPGGASAEPAALKIGLILPVSGPFAGLGQQIESGVKTFLHVHGGRIEGRPVELLVRDSTGIAPDVAKRLAQALIVRDKVDFLAGFALTPNARAVAPLATESKKPMIIMNAATSSLTTESPYIVRVSFTLPQVSAPLATWAAKNSIRTAYTLVSDYAAGADAEAQFRKTYEAAGGKIVGADKAPVTSPDFSPFVQRIKDAKPDAVFVFVPAGAQGIAFIKAFKDRGLADEGIRIIATGDTTEDQELDNMGDGALGVVTTHHYSAAHDSPENAAFKAAFAKVAGPQLRANFMAVGGYDGMAAIAAAVRALGPGPIDGDRAVQAMLGLEIASPRGPIRIDPATRDVVQTVYVRKVERRDGKLYNIEFDEFPAQKDPGK